MTSDLTSSSPALKTGVQAKADPSNDDLSTSTTSTIKKSHGKRKSASLPSETVEYLKTWMMSPEHIAHPYPTEQEKVKIMNDTKIELKQLTNWFVNNRKRYWKPRVEARLQQQAQAAQAAVQAHAAAVAAVSVANSLTQKQQVVGASSIEVSRANLVSPTVVGFKYAPKSTFSSQANNPAFVTFNPSSSPTLSVHQKSFVSSPLTFAAQIVEQRRNPVLCDPSISSGEAMNGNASSSSVASISASEGELSDTGNSSDDASADGATILGRHLKFIDLKKNIIKARAPSISSISLPSEIPRQTMEGRTNYTRNVSFCSLDKLSIDVVSTPIPQQSQASRSIVSKKRPLLADNDVGCPHVVETSASAYSPEVERKKIRSLSIDTWRKRCQDATHVYDKALPSLEEASRLFGFTSA